ncbi:MULTISPECIES: GGDEF domain-containing protein [Rhizobiaceae]|uniref:diguanylate cyclase n=1 Tax=Aliirhizobium cellulosilyticum TaxID=393664 RepID=A0A7W6S6H8_9HYPH|nr:GGDEF domain-containing protein [Rhizobium cellulosilyticum]MBB4348055.1 diguanylate cyclase (GGDEF)-like protein [Rhizobium cellulosilyticum]MBB4409551.1 diguanylate cyclase (GGDEF)-like protein [Rhizobium cellulosilyticum]MBB4444240.1 diguanylate cyclase (GGDEF)-like protein [Rhizobium cellulosilyticum]
MQWLNLGLFLIEAVVYFSVMTAFLHFRRSLGLGVFLAALGVMHFMETYLAAVFYVELPFGTVSPGSSIFFAGKLMMILMLYIKEDAATVRQPIYGLFLGNLLTVGIAQILQLHAAVTLPGGRAADMAFLDEMGWLMVWGTTILYVDAIAIILLYERLGRFVDNVVVRFAISGAVMLTFDQVAFFSVLHILLGVPLPVFFGGWYAKLLAVLIYSSLFAVYLRIDQNDRWFASSRQIKDIFHDLTFRERYQALLAKAGVDGLTGLLDRGRYEVDGPELVRKSLAMRQSISMVIVDADHFKEVNDRFGHQRGDTVLRDLAACLSRSARSSDHLSRFGGEEFVILLSDTDHEKALEVAERLRVDIAANITRPDGAPLTVSIGVATAPEDGRTLDLILSRADERLYQAKNNGRDRVHGRLGKF